MSPIFDDYFLTRNGDGGGAPSNIFDVFSKAGVPDDGIRASYAGADADWIVRGVQTTPAGQAFVLLPVSGSVNSWKLTFRERVATVPQGAAGNVWRAVRQPRRTVAVPAVKSSTSLSGITLTADAVGSDYNGWTFSLEWHAYTTLFGQGVKSARFLFAAGITRNDAITQINTWLQDNAIAFTASLQAGASGTERPPSSFHMFFPETAGSAVGLPVEAITVVFDPIARRVIFKILATDTLAQIRAAATFAATLTPFLTVTAVGVIVEAASTFAVPAGDTGISFAGGVERGPLEVSVDADAKRISVHYDERDTLDQITLALETANMQPFLRDKAVGTDSPEKPGWERPIGPITSVDEPVQYAFDLLASTGRPGLNASPKDADNSWKARGLAKAAEASASVLIPITRASDRGWRFTFKPDTERGASGNAWTAIRELRQTVAVAGRIADVFTNSMRIESNEKGTQYNGWRFSLRFNSGSTGHSVDLPGKSVTTTFAQGVTVNQVIVLLNGWFVAGNVPFTTKLANLNDGNIFSSGFATAFTSKGVDPRAVEPISITFDLATKVLTLKIAAADTLATIRATTYFGLAEFFSVITAVGAIVEATDTFDTTDTATPLPFTGGVDEIPLSVVTDRQAKLITIYYASTDTLGEIWTVMDAADLEPVYRGSGIPTDLPEVVGWERPLAAESVHGRGRVDAPTFVSLTDTPAIIIPGRELVGNPAGEALEFIRRATNQGGLEVVHVVPTDFLGAVLHLKHPATTQSGGISDRRLTPGFVAPDFYGYSDGTAYPAVGMLTGHAVPLAWIGSDRGTRDSNDVLTGWDVDYIASPSRSWLSLFKGGWIGGVGFALGSAEVFEGGVWLKGIAEDISFPNATAKTFNLKNNDDSVYFLAETEVFLPGGLLWWNETRYVLLGYDTLRYRGRHVPANTYVPGDLVVSASGRAYVCIAAAAANTLITDLTKWVTLTRTSIVDVTAQGGHPQIVEENKDQLHADFSIPRIWLPQHIPLAATPATGTSALWPIAGKYSGTHDYFPPNTPIGNIGYSRAQHIWQRKDSASARATLTLVDATAEKADFPGAYVWLGERIDAAAAAAHVSGNPAALAAATSYLFYNETTRVVEKLATYGQSVSPGERYEAMRLLTFADKSVKPTSGSPLVDALNQYEIRVDPTVPRAWIGERIPFAATPATGVSVQFPKNVAGKAFIGSFDADPPSAIAGPAKNVFGVVSDGVYVATEAEAITERDTFISTNPDWLVTYNGNRFLYIIMYWSGPGGDGIKPLRRNAAGDAWETFPDSYILTIGQTYYNKWRHYWAIFYDGIVSTGVWTHSDYQAAFRSYLGTTYWLGRRSSANDAAAHVAQPKDDNGRYVFYNTTTYQVEQLDTADIAAGVKARTVFHPIPLRSDADRPEVLVDTLASTAADVAVDIGTTAWTRRIASAAGTDEKNQIAFNRQLYPGDDHRLMSVELTWEELQNGEDSGGIKRRFMATISAGAFRRLDERTYMAAGSNKDTLNGSADWYIRRPNYTGTDLRQWAELLVSYGRFRAAYISNGLGDDSAAARAIAPDGMAFHFGLNVTTPNTTFMRKLKARIELHG